jgi:hypothetical protein
MEELTEFSTLVGRVVVMDCELSAMLDPYAKKSCPLSQAPLIGQGVRHAFGISSGITVGGTFGSEAGMVGDAVRSQQLEGILTESIWEAERSVLQGPSDNFDLEVLRKLGLDHERVLQVGEDRAAQEQELAILLDAEPKWRRGRLRDVISVRELEIEFQNILPRALEERGLVVADIMTGRESARAFVQSMPSTEVSIELKTAWHRNGEKKWTANDIYDIDAMSLAVPYCDIVVTEKASRHILRLASLDERMHTTILSNLLDLPRALEETKPYRNR